MPYKLVIAEKPSVAQSIAKVIGADKREDGYLEGKASFVAGFIVIITIFKDLYEYFRSELPLCVNGIYVLLCLILMLGILGTEKFDKYLNSKGVENFGTFLTVSSILIFVLENSIFKIEMDAIEAIGIWLICAIIVIGALYLLFSKYEK